MLKTKSLLLSLLLSLGISSVASTQAAVITFDDLPATEIDAIPDGYRGFNWGQSLSNVSYVHKDTLPGTGFEKGVVSGNYAAFNFLATTSIISGEIFDFNGAYLTAAWHDGLNIEVTGFLNNLATFTKTITVNTQQAQWFDFDFTGINSLSLRAWGSPSGNDFFVIDNFTINEGSVSVPESSPLILLLLGLTAIALGRRTTITKN
ncbi:MAG: exosortase [Cellvibrio sp. 79]|nr:MAG: exosortase [Cellvibrio sp. 79]